MSDTDKTTTTANKFTERELQILGWAMQSLKSGPPEVCDCMTPLLHIAVTNNRSTTRSLLGSLV